MNSTISELANRRGVTCTPEKVPNRWGKRCRVPATAFPPPSVNTLTPSWRLWNVTRSQSRGLTHAEITNPPQGWDALGRSEKAIAWLRYHPMSTDVVGLSVIAVMLIWGAFK